MTNCPVCRAPVSEGVSVCLNCGADLEVTGSANAMPDANQDWNGGTVVELGDPVQAYGAQKIEHLKPGTYLKDRYAIESVVGSGAMGVVYKAVDKETGMTCAVKVIHANLLSDQDAVDRLISEGLMTRDLRHRNIVAVHDVSRDGAQAFVVMEHIDGQSLREWFSRQREANNEIGVEVACGIINGVLDGLKVAHESDVIHRDLKPENIMLLGDPVEGDFRLRILDFGIAKAVGPSAFASAVRLGSPDYMAPEQKNAPEAVGPSADLYSLSRIFYELLMDVRPEGGFQAPSKFRSEIPRGIDTLLEKGLNLRPRSRQQSVVEYQSDLTQARFSPDNRIPHEVLAAKEPQVTDKVSVANDAEVIEKTYLEKVKYMYVGPGTEVIEIKSFFGTKKTERWKIWLSLAIALFVVFMLSSDEFWEGFNESYDSQQGYDNFNNY